MRVLRWNRAWSKMYINQVNAYRVFLNINGKWVFTVDQYILKKGPYKTAKEAFDAADRHFEGNKKCKWCNGKGQRETVHEGKPCFRYCMPCQGRGVVRRGV